MTVPIQESQADTIEILKQKLRDIEAAVKEHSVLSDFAYQGPPSKNWLKTEGRYWEGYNKKAREIQAVLEGCAVNFHSQTVVNKLTSGEI